MDSYDIPEVRQKVGAVTYRELTAGLVWPHLFKALTISLSPKLVALGFLSVLGMFGGGWVLDKLWVSLFTGGEDGSGLSPFTALRAFWPTGGEAELANRLNEFAAMSTSGEGWWHAVLALWCLPWRARGAGTSGRAAALVFGASGNPSARGNLKYTLARWQSVAVAYGVPIVLLLLFSGVLMLLGEVLFGELLFGGTVMPAIGGALYVVFIVLGFAIAVLSLLIVAGGWMLGAALGAEDTDGVDGIQRAYAYVVNRPVSFVIYGAILVALLVGGYEVVQIIFRFALEAAGGLSGAEKFARENGVSGIRLEGGSATPTTPFGVDAIVFWMQMTWLLFIGWVASYVWTSGAVLYLAMRRVHDQHDMFDIASEHPGSRAVIRPEVAENEKTNGEL